jgi:hypothetical protein
MDESTGKESFIAAWFSKAWSGINKPNKVLTSQTIDVPRELTLANRNEINRRDW